MRTNTDLLMQGPRSFTKVERPVLPDRPELRSGASMADHLGVVYDRGQIRDTMRNAAEEKYNNMDNEFRRSQDIYYDSVAANANALLGVARRGDREAAMSGATRGSQAANELSLMLGASAEAAAGATEMVQARDDLVRQREAELAQVETDALKYYNDLGLNLGQLSASELNALVTAYASEVAAIGGIYNTDVLAGVERDRIVSNERIEGSRITSNENIAKWLNDTNITVAKLQTTSNEDIARITGASNKEIEQMRINANKAAGSSGGTVYRTNAGTSSAVRSSGGSSSGGGGSTYGQITDQDRLGVLYNSRDMLLDSKGNLPKSQIDRWDEIQREIQRITGVPQQMARTGVKTSTTSTAKKTTTTKKSGTSGTSHMAY